MDKGVSLTHQLVHIQWFDSETLEGWTKLSEIEREMPATHTVGLLVDQTEAFYLVAHSVDPATESVNGVITIPRSAVHELRTLCRIKCG